MAKLGLVNDDIRARKGNPGQSGQKEAEMQGRLTLLTVKLRRKLSLWIAKSSMEETKIGAITRTFVELIQKRREKSSFKNVPEVGGRVYINFDNIRADCLGI